MHVSITNISVCIKRLVIAENQPVSIGVVAISTLAKVMRLVGNMQNDDDEYENEYDDNFVSLNLRRAKS